MGDLGELLPLATLLVNASFNGRLKYNAASIQNCLLSILRSFNINADRGKNADQTKYAVKSRAQYF